MVEKLGRTKSKNIFTFTWEEGKDWKAETQHILTNYFDFSTDTFQENNALNFQNSM